MRGEIKLDINQLNGAITACSHKSTQESEGVPVLERNSGKFAKSRPDTERDNQESADSFLSLSCSVYIPFLFASVCICFIN